MQKERGVSMSFFSRIFKKKKVIVFGKNIEASCSHCANNYSKQSIRCMFNEESPLSCSHYVYDPIKRKPSKMPKLKEYTSKDFEI